MAMTAFVAGSVQESDLLHDLERNNGFANVDCAVRRQMVLNSGIVDRSVVVVYCARLWRSALGSGTHHPFFFLFDQLSNGLLAVLSWGTRKSKTENPRASKICICNLGNMTVFLGRELKNSKFGLKYRIFTCILYHFVL